MEKFDKQISELLNCYQDKNVDEISNKLKGINDKINEVEQEYKSAQEDYERAKEKAIEKRIDGFLSGRAIRAGKKEMDEALERMEEAEINREALMKAREITESDLSEAVRLFKLKVLPEFEKEVRKCYEEYKKAALVIAEHEKKLKVLQERGVFFHPDGYAPFQYEPLIFVRNGIKAKEVEERHSYAMEWVEKGMKTLQSGNERQTKRAVV